MSVKKQTFGGCAFDRTSPPRKSFSPKTKILNVKIAFDQALLLRLALEQSTQKLHRYKRSTKQGKKAAINLAIHLDQARLTLDEASI